MTQRAPVQLRRFADIVLPQFDAESYPCMSYDTASVSPTIESLVGLRDERVLPGGHVPGKYAAVGYEEAYLRTHEPPRKDATPDGQRGMVDYKVLSLLKFEGYIAGLHKPFPMTHAMLPLIWLMPVLDPGEAVALWDDLRDLANSRPPQVQGDDSYTLALLVACALVAAGGLGEEVAAARRRALEIREQCVCSRLEAAVPIDVELLDEPGGALIWERDTCIYPEADASPYTDEVPAELLDAIGAVDPTLASAIARRFQIEVGLFRGNLNVDPVGRTAIDLHRITRA